MTSEPHSTEMSDSPTRTPTKEVKTFTLTLSERTRIDKDMAEQLFASLAEERYEAVEISGHSLYPAAANVAASALTTLAKKKCLRRFAIPDCIAGLDNNGAVSVLSSLCNAVGKHWNGLHVVDLSSNALGSRGVTACAAVLRDQPQLQELYLSNNGLAASTTKLLRMNLCDRRKTNLRVFQCTLNCVGSEGLRDIMEIVKCSPNLEHLRLSSLRALSDATGDLFNVLALTNRLRFLDISDNGVNEAGATALAAALEKQNNLEALIIRDLSLELPQLEEIIEPLLRIRAPLDTLDLSGNELTNDGCQLIDRILATLGTTLRCLYVADAELSSLGIESIARMIEACQPPALRTLSVACNKVRDHQAVTLSTAVLRLKQNFTELELDENYITDSTVAAIRQHLGNTLGSTSKMFPEDEWDEPEDEDEEYSQDDIQAAIEAMASAAMERTPPPEQFEKSTEALVADETPIEEEKQEEREKQENDNEQPPAQPDAMMIGMTSEISSEVPSVRESAESRRTSMGAEPGMTSAVTSNGANDEVTTSARKLTSDLLEIRGVLTDFVQDLNSVQDPSMPRRLFDESEETESLIDEETEPDVSGTKRQNPIADAISGLFVSVFLVILVLGIAKSNEEEYAFRPI